MKRGGTLILLLIAVIVMALTTACSPQTSGKVPDTTNTADSTNAAEQKAQSDTAAAEADKDSKSGEAKKPDIDPNVIKANENGQIMILMYHGISEKEQEWVRTPENFRKDLETLYQKGYRLISLKDYVENNIKVEAGYTPFVMTFDDSLQNQFNIIEEGGTKKLDPDCAVGILEDFFKEHPDFGRGGSFYVFYPTPFRQKELIKEKFDFLLKNGYEIGNHSYNHENLGKETPEGVLKSLAMNVSGTREYVADFEVFSLALPYGIGPKGEHYKKAVAGEYEGVKYQHKAVLLVGSNPAPAPNHVKFNPEKLPRVRASEMNTGGVGLYDWLAYLEKNPKKRYISDGDPERVTVPEEEAEHVVKERLNGKELVIYKQK